MADEEKPNRRTGRVNRQQEKEIDRIDLGNFTYIVIDSAGGIPCSACCFHPCSTKPPELEPCPCFRNKYHRNIYYRKIVKQTK